MLLLTGVVGRLVCVRAYADGAAVNALDETFFFQIFQIAPDGLRGNLKTVHQLLNVDKAGTVEHIFDAFASCVQHSATAFLGVETCPRCGILRILPQLFLILAGSPQ